MRGDIQVIPIESKMAHPWIRKKHYARRLPPVIFAFALVENDLIQGVVTYGPPSTNQVSNSLLGDKSGRNLLELNRLCLETDIENAASILVSRSLKILPAGMIVVSYADTRMGHVGYVYQATNFKYYGLTKAYDEEYFVDGKWIHSRSLSCRGITAHRKWGRENNIPMRPTEPKHRYLFFTGTKRDRKNLAKLVKWKALDKYPKSDIKAHYDAGPKLHESEVSLKKPENPQLELL